MIGWLLARRWRQLLLTLIGALVFAVAASTAIQYRNRGRVDISFTGATSGRMTEMASLAGHESSCVDGKVQGTDQWTGNFVGMVGGKPTELTIAIRLYHGAGAYVSAGFPDAATLSKLSMADFYQLKSSVHVALSRLPPRDYATPDYGTEPFPASRPTTLDQLKLLAGRGRASVKLNSDQKSGSIDATLMDTKTPSAQPVRVSGSFLCSRVERRSSSLDRHRPMQACQSRAVLLCF
jgi:hypothetical protein